MATIKDVARLAGVSVATVSRVINNSPKASEASRLAVHSAMESLSYHPNANARALAQQTTERSVWSLVMFPIRFSAQW